MASLPALADPAIDIQPIMSRVGNPYDNAKAESFMKSLKQEETSPDDFSNAPPRAVTRNYLIFFDICEVPRGGIELSYMSLNLHNFLNDHFAVYPSMYPAFTGQGAGGRA